MFSSKTSTILALTFRSIIHFVFIFVYDMRQGPNFSFFACRYPVVPILFLRKIFSFPTEWFWHLCWKSIGHGCMVYIWTFNSIPFIYMSSQSPWCFFGQFNHSLSLKFLIFKVHMLSGGRSMNKMLWCFFPRINVLLGTLITIKSHRKNGEFYRLLSIPWGWSLIKHIKYDDYQLFKEYSNKKVKIPL